MPVFFLLVLLFLGWFSYERKKSSKISEADSAKFWEREAQAAMTVRQPLDDVSFISPSADILPPANNNPELERLTLKYRELCTREIADLSDYTNTDLKLKYGVPNFNRLFEADTNYTELVQLLDEMNTLLLELGRTEELFNLLKYMYGLKVRTLKLTESLCKLADINNDIEFLRLLLKDAEENSSMSSELRGKIRITLNNKLNS